MGDACSTCCGGGGFVCCFGFFAGSGKGQQMVAADLHSSAADTGTKERRQVDQEYPVIQTDSTTIASSVRDHGRHSEKFSDFSLHGVQRTYDGVVTDTQTCSGQQTVSLTNISSFFNQYKDQHCADIMLAEGVARFCDDLSVDPSSFIVLVLAWKFKAATMCKFSREEFTNGCVALQADSLELIIKSFPALEDEAANNFNDLYKFTFQFGLDSEQGQRSLPVDIAIAMWRVVFSKIHPPLLEPWLDFLEATQAHGISRDTWNMFLHFIDNISPDLNNYDDNEAWPSMFDDFVDYYSEHQLLRARRHAYMQPVPTCSTKMPVGTLSKTSSSECVNMEKNFSAHRINSPRSNSLNKSELGSDFSAVPDLNAVSKESAFNTEAPPLVPKVFTEIKMDVPGTFENNLRSCDGHTKAATDQDYAANRTTVPSLDEEQCVLPVKQQCYA